MAGDVQAPVHDSRDLCRQWQTRATGRGWAFPSDWNVPAVEAVCDAITAREDVWAAAERLGASRAACGVGLGEALADIDGLAAIVHRRYTDPLRRAVSLGWADRISCPPALVTDPLTGLVTTEYLQVRLGEVYNAAQANGGSAATGSALVTIRLDLAGRTGPLRALPMILVGNAMRQVFDGGQTLALLGESVAVVLSERDRMLARRARLLSRLIVSTIEVDPQARIPPPGVWIESLPASHGAALDLLADLCR